MTVRMPKSKTSKHLANLGKISEPRETDDGRGFVIVRFRTLAVLLSINSIYHKQDFFSGQSHVDRKILVTSFPLYFWLFHGSHRGWLNGFSVLFAKFDSSHKLGVVPMGTSGHGIRAKQITDNHWSLYWKRTWQNTLLAISVWTILYYI